MRRCVADSWTSDCKEGDTYGFVGIDYECPYCFCSGGVNVYVADGDDSITDVLAENFEAEIECENCGKPITVLCYGDTKL